MTTEEPEERRDAERRDERALSFECHGQQLFGVASVPPQHGARGVLIVVGGPQYRAGSHRQFVQLARGLAAQGIASMRFDYRGMGDSGGELRSFESVDDDLRAALDQFMAAAPGLREVVIWGLCDAASAALFYAGQDARVSGLVLLNPWARTDEGAAKATIRHYYTARLMDPALWKKIARGGFDFRAAGLSLFSLLRAAFGPRPAPAVSASASASPSLAAAPAPLRARMEQGLQGFKGKVLIIISGADLTGQEFMDMARGSKQWRAALSSARVTQHTLAQADHTFSRRIWKDQVVDWTAAWVRSW